MTERSYTCENCFNKMYMTENEYKERAMQGLVMCHICRMFVLPKKAPRMELLHEKEG